MRKFKIPPDDPELRDSAEKAFEKCMQSGYYETAADLGYIFELRNEKVREAARIVWEECMKKEEFTKARSIKKKHKLQKKMTKKIAEDMYQSCLEKNKLDVARKIRDDYNISIGFFSWLIEFIKKILMWLGGGKLAVEEEVQQ